MDSVTLIQKSQFLTCKFCHDFKQVQDVELVHLLEKLNSFNSKNKYSRWI